MGKKHLLCLSCNKYLVPWGKTAAGRKRYYCRRCKISRTFLKQVPKRTNPHILFKQYVLWGHTYEMLASLSGYSKRFLEGQFHTYLEQDPPELPRFRQATSEAFLLIDGLWFSRYFVLMAYRQSGNLYLLHIAVCGREVSTKIVKDLRQVKALGYHFTGVVSDGATGIIKAVQAVFPHAPHQQCLAHRHRDIITAIGRYPKQERIKELKYLADHLWLIESKEALRWWEEQVQVWIKGNTAYLKEKRYDLEYKWWYIHKGSRRAITILQELPQTSFKFLDHPLMPKTTNEIEAQFGHIGKRWLAHRGLKRERWEKFLRWFVYFYNQEKLS